MTCRRNCLHGYLGTAEIPDYSDNDPEESTEITPGRIGMHLEFCARVGQRTGVKLCPCQTDPNGTAEARRRERKAWRL